MEKPLIHPASESTLSLLMADLPQSLLLTGPEGIGLSTVATYIAHTVNGQVIIILPEKDDKVDTDKGTITVKSIRALYDQTRTIQTGKLVIIIDYAERMATSAQNAFLKLLEEPGTNVHFILATHTPSKLLPTITSRTQLLELRPLNRTQTDDFLNRLDIKDAAKRSQLLFMADGLPAELYRLVSDVEYFEGAAQIVRDARDLLQDTPYKKLLIAQKYKDNREGALQLLTTAARILQKSISAKPQISLIAQIDDLLFAHQQIKANGNIRLCLARFVL